ncbi:hypothetical protein KJ836_02700 [Patescibacteria group bacterium]|nr:hypothetical protein [Patescibacteria group bacterium]
MNKKIALLEYQFLFDPSETWSNLYQFEADLAKFFLQKGLEANVIKTVDGSNGRRILLIERKPMIGEPKTPQGRPKTPQGILKDMKKHNPKAPERDFGTRRLNVSKLIKK